jgi:hypothetical protein
MWLDPFRRFWERHLDALATEIARGKRERRTGHEADRKRAGRANQNEETHK